MTQPLPIAAQGDEFDRSAVAEAWQAFVAGRPFPRAAVRDVVSESWQRCAERGLSPRGACAPCIDAADLAGRARANRELLVAADHTWQLLSESLAASDNVFAVADAAGVILEVRGNPEFLAAAARQRCGEGRDWSESTSGTNAIGTALVLGRPTIVRSTEHYCEAAKIWDCAAAPIRDLDSGRVLGVLNVTSVGDLSDSHTLALAVTAAHQVEHTLHAQELARSVQLLNWYRLSAARWRDKAALLLDRGGRVIRAGGSVPACIATHPQPFSLARARPHVVDDLPARIVETVPYRPPPDLSHEADAETWHGGVVVIATRGTREPHAAGDRGAPVALPHPAFERIVTRDAHMLELMQQATRMARANSPILLHGETGSGKELFARAIHECSGVAGGPFVAVNCGTLTRELAAAELFGYAAGAFTGAAPRGRAGKFELADGGTLFLDEIGELPADVQVNLLRVLQDNVVVPVGSERERHVAVRIIAASHRDLAQDAEQGRFRADLLFRLRVLSLSLPPLRDRREDIPLLVERFLQLMQATYGLGARRASADLIDVLSAHPWPGNVRELHGVIESLYILSDRAQLTPADLPDSFSADALPAAPQGSVAADEPARGSLDEVEQAAIVAAISRQAGNMSAVARQLGVSRSTLYRKLRQYGIARDGRT